MPTTRKIEGEEYLKEYRIFHFGYGDNPYGIEWMRYEDECELPELVKTMPHIAFEVENVYEAIRGKNVIIEPNSPSEGCLVAFIEECGMPIEFIQFDKKEEAGHS